MQVQDLTPQLTSPLYADESAERKNQILGHADLLIKCKQCDCSRGAPAESVFD